jgi:hypothetical protein
MDVRLQVASLLRFSHFHLNIERWNCETGERRGLMMKESDVENTFSSCICT